jgi:hypothetical protein
LIFFNPKIRGTQSGAKIPVLWGTRLKKMDLNDEQWALIRPLIPPTFSVFSALSVAKSLLIDKFFKGKTPHFPEVSWSKVPRKDSN